MIPTHKDSNGLLVELPLNGVADLHTGKVVKATYRTVEGELRVMPINLKDYHDAGLTPLNKSEYERGRIDEIADAMHPKERKQYDSMLASLMASIGHPVHGHTFMLAVARANVEIACHSIAMGIVDENGDFK